MDIILVGSGGCMRELAWQIIEDNKISNKWNILGYVDEVVPKNNYVSVENYMIPYLGKDEYLINLENEANVVLSIGNSKLRRKLFEKYSKNPNLKYPNLILNDTKICKDLRLGKGCVVTKGSIISTNVKIGDFVFINTESLVCHDCNLGNFVTLSPRCQLAGKVSIGNNSEIGMNATIIQCINLGNNIVVGAGATVVSDFESNCTVVGVPARKVDIKK